MKTKIWSKSQTQSVIKALRNAGLTVNKTHSGYESSVGKTVVFRALIGSQGYLVSHDENLFA